MGKTSSHTVSNQLLIGFAKQLGPALGVPNNDNEARLNSEADCSMRTIVLLHVDTDLLGIGNEVRGVGDFYSKVESWNLIAHI